MATSTSVRSAPRRDEAADADIGPGPLPPFAAFARRRSVDPANHRHHAAELSSLGVGAVPARIRAFRLGRSAAHAAIRRLGSQDAPIPVGPDRVPLWPAGITGAISHTSDVAVALVADAACTDGVGVDIEARRHAPELREQVPRSEERRWLEAAPASRDDLVLALFSAKESIFKAFYPRVGGFFGFEAASLRPTAGGFEANLVADLDEDYGPDRSFGVRCRWFGDLVMTWLILPRTARSAP